MALPIEDYALVGDRRTGALVGRNGSVDWLCLPRFDSPACFAGLLGTDDHGHWQLCPVDEYDVRRRYIGGSPGRVRAVTTPRRAGTLPDAMSPDDGRGGPAPPGTGCRRTARGRA